MDLDLDLDLGLSDLGLDLELGPSGLGPNTDTCILSINSSALLLIFEVSEKSTWDACCQFDG